MVNAKSKQGYTGFKARSRDDKIIAAICYTFVTIFALTIIYPMLNVFSVAFANYADYLRRPWMFYPKEIDFAGVPEGVFKHAYMEQL